MTCNVQVFWPGIPARRGEQIMNPGAVFEAIVEEDRFALESALLAVGDLMSRQVVTIAGARPLSDAIALFNEHGFRHLIVVEGPDIVGVLSDRSTLRALVRASDAGAVSVAAAMTRQPITIKPDTTASQAIHALLTHRINCLPVVGDDGALQGILTTTDLLRAHFCLLRWLESRAPQLSH